MDRFSHDSFQNTAAERGAMRTARHVRLTGSAHRLPEWHRHVFRLRQSADKPLHGKRPFSFGTGWIGAEVLRRGGVNRSGLNGDRRPRMAAIRSCPEFRRRGHMRFGVGHDGRYAKHSGFRSDRCGDAAMERKALMPCRSTVSKSRDTALAVRYQKAVISRLQHGIKKP